MAALPESDFLRGYLPPGIHPASHEDIRKCFGGSIPRGPLDWSGPQREKLFSGYERLVAALESVGLPVEQWLGGSFISRAAEPGDIDLVNYCDVYVYESLSHECKAMIYQYFQGERTAKHCHCDSYFVPIPPTGQQQNEDFQIIRAYWEKDLGHDRCGRPKGIVSRVVDVPRNDGYNEATNADAA